ERVARLRRSVSGLSTDDASQVIDELAAATHPASERQQTRGLVEAAVDRCALGTDLPLDAVIDAMCLPARARVDLFPGARELLNDLASRGVRVVVLSNVVWRDGEAQRRDF